MDTTSAGNPSLLPAGAGSGGDGGDDPQRPVSYTPITPIPQDLVDEAVLSVAELTQRMRKQERDQRALIDHVNASNMTLFKEQSVSLTEVKAELLALKLLVREGKSLFPRRRSPSDSVSPRASPPPYVSSNKMRTPPPPIVSPTVGDIPQIQIPGVFIPAHVPRRQPRLYSPPVYHTPPPPAEPVFLPRGFAPVGILSTRPPHPRLGPAVPAPGAFLIMGDDWWPASALPDPQNPLQRGCVQSGYTAVGRRSYPWLYQVPARPHATYRPRLVAVTNIHEELMLRNIIASVTNGMEDPVFRLSPTSGFWAFFIPLLNSSHWTQASLQTAMTMTPGEYFREYNSDLCLRLPDTPIAVADQLLRFNEAQELRGLLGTVAGPESYLTLDDLNSRADLRDALLEEASLQNSALRVGLSLDRTRCGKVGVAGHLAFPDRSPVGQIASCSGCDNEALLREISTRMLAAPVPALGTVPRTPQTYEEYIHVRPSLQLFDSVTLREEERLTSSIDIFERLRAMNRLTVARTQVIHPVTVPLTVEVPTFRSAGTSRQLLLQPATPASVSRPFWMANTAPRPVMPTPSNPPQAGPSARVVAPRTLTDVNLRFFGR
jgi:hypothetical protein